MPRRNQSGPPRKGLSRTGARRSAPRKDSGRAKPYKSFGKGDDRKSGYTGKPYGEKRSGRYGSTRGEGGKSSHSARPYKRSETGSSHPRNKGFGASDGDTGNKGFGQRSRFAKSPSARPSGTGNPRESYSGNRSGNSSGDTRRSAGGTRALRGNLRATFPKTEGGDRRKERGTSYGKPYKKTYRPASDSQRPTGRRKRIADVDPATPKSDKVRLNKFIANSGISSRREADELIKMGLISVNGSVVSELGYKVNPGDEVRYEDRVLRAEKLIYVLMNKPKGFITTTDDPQERKTVMQIIGSIVKERIYPVGRLDRNTTGLLLLTNDGDLADKLMHPSFNVRKVYKVELDRALTKNDFQSIVEGVRLEEGKVMVDDLAIVSEDGRTVGVELHIGWNRVVRRIFESFGYEVVKLDRTVYAGLDKKELARGQWRFLTREEIIHLKHFK